jgi:hypothetical protein
MSIVQQTTLRFALVLYHSAPESPCTPTQRAWLRTRLAQETILSVHEVARLTLALRPWLEATYPQVAAIVLKDEILS